MFVLTGLVRAIEKILIPMKYMIELRLIIVNVEIRSRDFIKL